MIDSTQVTITDLIIHHVGAKAKGEEVRYSKQPYQFIDNDEVGVVLKSYFFRPFKGDAYYNFYHEEEISQNPAYSLVHLFFNQQISFYDLSVQLSGLLYDSSNHAKINAGEFYLAAFDNVVVEGELVQALGIFKSENKEIFLKVYLKDQNFEVGTQEGINVRKLDKGCIIFNTESDAGYKICSVDNLNKGNEALFWKENFLGLKPREDNYYYTNNYLKMCRGFVDEVYNAEGNVPRSDQVDLLNRSYEFFTKKDSFKEPDFEREVIRQPEVIDAFNQYKEHFETEKSMPLMADFDISKSAVKGEKKHFKSIIKLDKNFHVYVHGQRNYIERGYDNDKGLNFYKLFYHTED